MPQAALRELLLAADLGSNAVQISGDDPVLPIRFRVAAAAAASLGALGVAVSKLWDKPQRISVSARAAAVSLRSARYLRLNGKPSIRTRAPSRRSR